MKPFQLVRFRDVSGCSGEGVVAEGMEFSSGKAVLSWCLGPAGASSIGIYNDIEELVRIHGHNGDTVVNYLHLPPQATLPPERPQISH